MADNPTEKNEDAPPGNNGPNPTQQNPGEEIGEEDSEGTASSDEKGGIMSPEGVLMLFIAGVFDAVGLIPAINIISDIIAGIIFGLWIFFIRREKKAAIKFVVAFVLELVPIVSDVTPFVSLIGLLFGKKLPASWIGCVYSIIGNKI